MEIVIIKDSVIHDKVKRQAGDIITVGEKDGAAMVKRGLAKEVDSKPEEKGPEENTQEETGEDTQEEGDVSPSESIVDPDKLSRDELAQELSLRGITFKQTASRDSMINLLKNVLEK
jgi:hypothetical protein